MMRDFSQIQAEVKTRFLDAVRVGVSVKTTIDDIIQQLNVESYLIPPFAQDMVVYLSAEIYAERLQPYTYSIPKSWWQHFKQEYFPEWILEYFPVQSKKIVISSKVMYPEYTPPRAGMKYVVLHEIGGAEYTDPKEELKYCCNCGYPQFPTH